MTYLLTYGKLTTTIKFQAIFVYVYRVVQNKWHPWLIFSITLVKVHQF